MFSDRMLNDIRAFVIRKTKIHESDDRVSVMRTAL